jgi:hypothetical protein
VTLSLPAGSLVSGYGLMLCRAPTIRRAVAGDPGRVPGGMLGHDMALELPLLAQPTPALEKPFGAAAWDLLGLRGALGLQRLLGLAQNLAAIPARPQPSGSSSPRSSPNSSSSAASMRAASSRISRAICS